MATTTSTGTRRGVLAMLAGSTALTMLPGALARAQVLADRGCGPLRDAIAEVRRQLATIDLWVDGHWRLQRAEVSARLTEVKVLLRRSDGELALLSHDQFFEWAGLASATAVLLCAVFDTALAALLGVSVMAFGAGVFLGSMFVGFGLLIWQTSTRPGPGAPGTLEAVSTGSAERMAYALSEAPDGALGASERVLRPFAKYFSGVVALWNVQKLVESRAETSELERAIREARAALPGLEEDLERLSDPATFRAAQRDNLEGVIEALESINGEACQDAPIGLP